LPRGFLASPVPMPCDVAARRSLRAAPEGIGLDPTDAMERAASDAGRVGGVGVPSGAGPALVRGLPSPVLSDWFEL
jgi:hypothetical protein